MVVLLALAEELNAVEKLYVSHEAGHYKSTLGAVQNLRDLGHTRLDSFYFLKRIFIVLVYLVDQHIVIVLLTFVEFTALNR